MSPFTGTSFSQAGYARPGALALRFVAALSLANAPYWWLSTTEFMSRGFFNVDVAVALCLMPFARMAGIALLSVCWGADWILSQSLTFHFRTPSEFMHAFRHATELDYRAYLGWEAAVATLPFVTSVAFIVQLTRGQRQLWRPALIVTMLLVLLDAGNGSSILSDRGVWRYAFNLAGSPTTTLVAQWHSDQATAPLHAVAIEDTVQGMVDIPRWAELHPRQSVLFVIAESMGVPTSAESHAWLKSQLVDPALESQFEVHTAALPFRGSTTSGELRSLCALAGSYRSMDAKTGADCLPARLAELGWSTVGMHGFSKQMFNRSKWWPVIGLQSMLFIDAPEFRDRPRCGAAFRGGCDRDLIEVGTRALAPGKRFVYLLTLNTHLPVEPLPDGSPAPSSCAGPEADGDVCRHLAATGQLLREVRRAVDTAPVKPLVVVVGDHAPPFANKRSRQAYLQDKVPAFMLVPRD